MFTDYSSQNPQYQVINAVSEWETNMQLAEMGMEVRYLGYVQCFCDEKFAAGDAPDSLYGVKQQPICLEYHEQILPTLFFTTGISFGIITCNVLLKQIAIHLITWIGYETFSKLMARITNGVLLVLFFNTAILMLLTNANFTEFGGPLGTIIKGHFYDYSPTWYATVGNTLVQTMLLNAFMPFIFESLQCVLRWFFIAWDSGQWCNCCKRKHERYYSTKQRQIYAFVDLYAGPEYIIHFKFASVLNVTYVTMMYGLGLPLLFPIALLSYFVFWLVERFMIAYIYKLPP